jgi:hypothetical protein
MPDRFFEQYFRYSPLHVPLILSLLRIMMQAYHSDYRIQLAPSDAFYYGCTVMIWAMTECAQRRSGSGASRNLKAEFGVELFVITSLVIDCACSALFYQIQGNHTAVFWILAGPLSIVFGLISPVLIVRTLQESR